MFLRVNNTIINTDQITSIRVQEDEKDYPSGKIQNYINVYFSEDDKEKLVFETKEKLREFLEFLQIRNV